MLSFFEFYLFFGAVVCIAQLQCVVETFLTHVFFINFSFLTQNDDFARRCSVSLVAIFWNFQNTLIFRIISCFLEPFFPEKNYNMLKKRFSMFFAFLIFAPRWGIFEGYSLCLVAILAVFKKALIFRILVVFKGAVFS